MGGDDRAGRDGFGSGRVGLGGGAAAQGPVRPDGVVVAANRFSWRCSLGHRWRPAAGAASHFFRVWWNRSTLPQVWGW